MGTLRVHSMGVLYSYQSIVRDLRDLEKNIDLEYKCTIIIKCYSKVMSYNLEFLEITYRVTYFYLEVIEIILL